MLWYFYSILVLSAQKESGKRPAFRYFEVPQFLY